MSSISNSLPAQSGTQTSEQSSQNDPKNNRVFSRNNVFKTLLTGYVPLILATLIILVPMAWMFLTSIKPPAEIATATPSWIVKNPTIDNYENALDSIPFFQIFLNSVIVTTVGSILKVLLAIFTAYGLVFISFPFKKTIFLGILIALMVPPQISLLPNYSFIISLGGQNTYWGLILPGLGTAFGTFLLRQHMLTIPPSILEAAEIDGASHFKKLWKIVVPISGPTIATVALVTIVTEWNEFIWPLVLTTDKNMMTLPVGLSMLYDPEKGMESAGVFLAGAVLVVLPILFIFALVQRHIISGLTQGALAGQ